MDRSQILIYFAGKNIFHPHMNLLIGLYQQGLKIKTIGVLRLWAIASTFFTTYCNLATCIVMPMPVFIFLFLCLQSLRLF